MGLSPLQRHFSQFILNQVKNDSVTNGSTGPEITLEHLKSIALTKIELYRATFFS